MSRVVVVGAGAVGLTCAVALVRAGHRVDVVARDLPRETASATGPGLWHPQDGAADPRYAAWAAASEEELRALATSDGERYGVRVLPGTDARGREHEVPVVDPPRYLDHLAAELDRLGGTLTRMQLSALPSGADVVVDATGLGARHFDADPTVTPVREQVVVVDGVDLGRWWLGPNAGAATYVVPRTRDVVVGAAVVPGEWDRTVSPEQSAAVLARATRLVPTLAGARVVGARVALWPDRPSVRLARVGDVVHCHGLGARAVTLAWGCARDVVELVGPVGPHSTPR